ncbi:MAG: SDR family oxidoreductase [Parvularculaceae bacterium]
MSNSKGRLAGKKIFITGGAQGLGACFGRMCASEGAKVALTDIQGDAVQATAEAINQDYPGSAVAFSHDVTSKEQWQEALKGAAKTMDGISVLINNAGIGGFGNIENETFELYRKTMAIDLDSIFIGTQLAMPYLKDNQPGSIINISSVAGLLADGNYIAYNTAKAGVLMMSKSIAIHCAKSGYKITCNSVHPVFTRTAIIEPMVQMAKSREEGEAKLARNIPMRRLGEPEEVGHMIVYLASNEAQYVTGTDMKIDGGIVAGPG